MKQRLCPAQSVPRLQHRARAPVCFQRAGRTRCRFGQNLCTDEQRQPRRMDQSMGYVSAVPPRLPQHVARALVVGVTAGDEQQIRQTVDVSQRGDADRLALPHG